MVATQDEERSSATFGRNLDIERSLDFLLLPEVLNEVGGRSPYKGGSESTSGLLQSLGVSLDSDQENTLTRAMDSPLKSQPLEVKEIYLFILLYFSLLLALP